MKKGSNPPPPVGAVRPDPPPGPPSRGATPGEILAEIMRELLKTLRPSYSASPEGRKYLQRMEETINASMEETINASAEGKSRFISPVHFEVVAERAHQDEKWGGPEHDDQYTVGEFLYLVENYAVSARALSSMGSRKGKARHRLIQVAALAVAAVESIDRKAPEPTILQPTPETRGN